MTPEEFRKQILPEGRRLYSLAYRYLNIREEAEDVVQDVMTKIWERRDTLERYENIQALLTTMTRNMCIDRLRRMKTMVTGDEGVMRPWTEMEQGISLERHEASSLARKIISRLKEPYRSAVILHDVEGYSYDEAAEALGTNVNNLRTILSRARKSVREELDKIYRYGTGENKGAAQQIL